MLSTGAATLQALMALVIVLCVRDTVPEFWVRVLPAAAFFAAMIVAGVLVIAARSGNPVPVDQALASIELVKLAGCGGVFLTFAILGTERGRLRLILAALAIFGGCYALVTLWFYQEDPTHVFGVAKGLRFNRFTGTLLNANVAGCLFGVFALLTLGWLQGLVSQRRWALVSIAAVSLMLCLGGMVQTQSRAAFVLTFLLVGALLCLRFFRSRRGERIGRATIIAIGVICLVIASVAATQGLLSRFGLLGADWQTRMMSFRIYSALAEQAPLWGYGLGEFPRIHAMLLTPENATLLWNFNAAHSAPLQFLLEAGPVLSILLCGALTYLATFVMFSRARPADMQFYAAIASVVLVMGCSLVDIALNVPAVAALAAALGGLVFGASAAPYALNSRSAGSGA